MLFKALRKFGEIFCVYLDVSLNSLGNVFNHLCINNPFSRCLFNSTYFYQELENIVHIVDKFLFISYKINLATGN